MNIIVKEQQRIMWRLSELQADAAETLDDIQINEEFSYMLDESNYNLDDWVLEFTDLQAIKFNCDDEFQIHLDFKYPTNDNQEKEK